MDPYELLLQQLAQQSAPAQPMFTPEQVQQRVGQNNAQMSLGVLGQLAGDQRVRGLGGQVFKTALGGREERVTNRGITDPLTGETAIDPTYKAEQDENRRGRILQQAVAIQQRRDAEAQRAATAAEGRALRLAIAASRGGGGGGAAPMAKPPSGYRYKPNGELEAIPGGPAAAKVENENRARNVRMEGLKQRVGQVLDLVNVAEEQTGTFTTGVLGRAASAYAGPGGTASDLRQTINAIKANIGFQELQQMREASPTGGALGQVAVQELNYLQSVLGSLDPDKQSETQLRDNLGRVRKHFQNWINLAGGGSIPGDGVPPPSPAPAAPPVAPGAAPAATPAPAAPAPAPSGESRTRLRLVNGQLVPVQQ